MSHVNSVTVSGNLTADPEIKKVGNDDFAIVNLRLANNRQKKNQETGDYEEEASFFDVTVFGKFAELCDRKLRKADAITVQGRLQQDRWETPEGDKRSKVIIVANEIDSKAFFQKDDEVKAKESGVTGAQNSTDFVPAGAAAATDDDIPF